jgi:hypothetical protein
LRRLVDATDRAAGFPAEARDAITHLLAFLAAIPVLEDDAGAEHDGVSDV